MERLRATPLLVNQGHADIPFVGKEAIPLSQTTGVILSGGLGTRMEEVTHGKIPKHVLLLRKHSSILDNPLMFMRQAGIQNIFIITQSLTHDALRKHTGNNSNFDGIHYLVEDNPPTGTMNILQTLIREAKIQTPLIKANGDEVFTYLDIQDMYNTHVKNRQPITCLLTDDSEGSGAYRLRIDHDGRVIEMLEDFDLQSSNQGEHFGTGLWIIDPSQFGLLDQSVLGREFMKRAIKSRVLYGYLSHSQFFNINTPQDLTRARTVLG